VHAPVAKLNDCLAPAIVNSHAADQRPHSLQTGVAQTAVSDWVRSVGLAAAMAAAAET
jgi:hypothetical protein